MRKEDFLLAASKSRFLQSLRRWKSASTVFVLRYFQANFLPIFRAPWNLTASFFNPELLLESGLCQEKSTFFEDLPAQGSCFAFFHWLNLCRHLCYLDFLSCYLLCLVYDHPIFIETDYDGLIHHPNGFSNATFFHLFLGSASKCDDRGVAANLTDFYHGHGRRGACFLCPGRDDGLYLPTLNFRVSHPFRLSCPPR